MINKFKSWILIIEITLKNIWNYINYKNNIKVFIKIYFNMKDTILEIF